MDNYTYAALAIAVSALVTAGLRFAPFLLFRGARQTPELLSRLGELLPGAIMGMLVVYCLKDTSFLSAPFGAPELLGCAAVVALHVWKRSTLLSIAGGTAVYMILVNFVF